MRRGRHDGRRVSIEVLPDGDVRVGQSPEHLRVDRQTVEDRAPGDVVEVGLGIAVGPVPARRPGPVAGEPAAHEDRVGRSDERDAQTQAPRPRCGERKRLLGCEVAVEADVDAILRQGAVTGGDHARPDGDERRPAPGGHGREGRTDDGGGARASVCRHADEARIGRPGRCRDRGGDVLVVGHVRRRLRHPLPHLVDVAVVPPCFVAPYPGRHDVEVGAEPRRQRAGGAERPLGELRAVERHEHRRVVGSGRHRRRGGPRRLSCACHRNQRRSRRRPVPRAEGHDFQPTTIVASIVDGTSDPSGAARGPVGSRHATEEPL